MYWKQKSNKWDMGKSALKKELGKLIQKKRFELPKEKKCKISQEKIAEKFSLILKKKGINSEYSSHTIGDWERGKYFPNLQIFDIYLKEILKYTKDKAEQILRKYSEFVVTNKELCDAYEYVDIDKYETVAHILKGCMWDGKLSIKRLSKISGIDERAIAENLGKDLRAVQTENVKLYIEAFERVGCISEEKIKKLKDLRDIEAIQTYCVRYWKNKEQQNIEIKSAKFGKILKKARENLNLSPKVVTEFFNEVNEDYHISSTNIKLWEKEENLPDCIRTLSLYLEKILEFSHDETDKILAKHYKKGIYKNISEYAKIEDCHTVQEYFFHFVFKGRFTNAILAEETDINIKTVESHTSGKVPNEENLEKYIAVFKKKNNCMKKKEETIFRNSHAKYREKRNFVKYLTDTIFPKHIAESIPAVAGFRNKTKSDILIQEATIKQSVRIQKPDISTLGKILEQLREIENINRQEASDVFNKKCPEKQAITSKSIEKWETQNSQSTFRKMFLYITIVFKLSHELTDGILEKYYKHKSVKNIYDYKNIEDCHTPSGILKHYIFKGKLELFELCQATGLEKSSIRKHISGKEEPSNYSLKKYILAFKKKGIMNDAETDDFTKRIQAFNKKVKKNNLVYTGILKDIYNYYNIEACNTPSDFLKHYILKRKLTLVELSSVAGIEYGTLKNHILGKYKITEKVTERYVIAFCMNEQEATDFRGIIQKDKKKNPIYRGILKDIMNYGDIKYCHTVPAILKYYIGKQDYSTLKIASRAIGLNLTSIQNHLNGRYAPEDRAVKKYITTFKMSDEYACKFEELVALERKKRKACVIEGAKKVMESIECINFIKL